MELPGPKYPEICREAVKKNIIINTVQCGSIVETGPVWTKLRSVPKAPTQPSPSRETWPPSPRQWMANWLS
jgi:hypothetical protein